MKYEVNVLPLNCAQLKKEDIHQILQNVLYEFPVSVIEFYMPKWVEMLSDSHPMKQELMSLLWSKVNTYHTLRDCREKPLLMESEFLKGVKMENMNLADGCIKIRMDMDDSYYYEMLSGMLGEKVTDEYQMLGKLKEYASMKNEYTKVLEAMQDVRYRGYGVVKPNRDEIELHQPEVIRHGNKYGVKIKAISPSVHMIKANIETEIAPIVGTQQQAEDLIKYIGESAQAENGIWDTNIFGKTVEQLVNDGIAAKTAAIGEECQVKLQDTMQKVVNDSNGGMVCIII
jgi:stage IV sporulation protein A